MDNKKAINGFLEYNRKRYRIIPLDKVYINRNTPCGDEAEFYERKPYGGRRYFTPILEIENCKINKCFSCIFSAKQRRWEYKISKEMVKFLLDNNITIPDKCDDATETSLIKEENE